MEATAKEFVKYLKSKGVVLNYHDDAYPATISFPYCYITASGIEYPISEEEIKRAQQIKKQDWVLFGKKPVSSVIIFGEKLKKLFRFSMKRNNPGRRSINKFQSFDECNDFYNKLMERIRTDIN